MNANAALEFTIGRVPFVQELMFPSIPRIQLIASPSLPKTRGSAFY